MAMLQAVSYFSISRLAVHIVAAAFLYSSFCPKADAEPAQFTAEAVNTAELTPAPKGTSPSSRALIAKVQILLARARFSPGEIDGKKGENLEKALRAFAEAQGLPPKAGLTKELWTKLLSASAAPAVVEYQITADDLKGPFASELPSRMEDMKSLDALSYTSAAEALAERFHMSEELLRALNAGKAFDRAGETIMVANVASGEATAKVSRIEVDKAAQTIRAFDKENKLVAFYPATVGSEEKPSPSGALKVTGIQKNPTYWYNPEYAFKGVGSTEPFTIKPGPNNPVGVVWIGLSEKGYGIHGTSDPAKVSKAESHGCVRLTNWDAQDLAEGVSKGTSVEFLAERPSRTPAMRKARKNIHRN